MITQWHKDTPQQVKDILQDYCHSDRRLRLFFGENGNDWGEENHVIGYIGNSTGAQKIPLLIHNRRSLGGPGILDHCIVRIIDVTTRRELYRHPEYFLREYTIEHAPDNKNYPYWASQGQDMIAGFKTRAQCERWIAFMKGERMSK